MHKILIFMLVGISVLTIKVGHSQELSQATILTLPIKPEDIGYYCIFDNKVYSPGAQICLEVIRSEAPAQAACRILVRWEYHPQNFLGFVQLACLIVLFNCWLLSIRYKCRVIPLTDEQWERIRHEQWERIRHH